MSPTASALHSPSATPSPTAPPFGPAGMAGGAPGAGGDEQAGSSQGPSQRDQLLGAVERTRRMDGELEQLAKTFPVVAQDVTRCRDLVKTIMRKIASGPGMNEPQGPGMVG